MSPLSLGWSVVLIGAGAIGSRLAGLIARCPQVGSLWIVDPARFDQERDVASQEIDPADLGRPKARVAAERALRIRPGLRVEAIEARVEDVPLGLLRCDLLLSCPDSRAARVAVNRIALRLGCRWVDAGVLADGSLARVDVYPGGAAGCLQCTYSEEDYALLEARHPCDGSPAASPPTGAPAWLGALAAALQAQEGLRLLSLPREAEGESLRILVDGAHRALTVTRLPRSLECQAAHEPIPIEPAGRAPWDLRIDELAERCRGIAGPAGGFTLALEGQPFAGRLGCFRCGKEREVLMLVRRIPAPLRECPRCGGELAPIGFHQVERLELSRRSGSLSGPTLSDLGFRPRDVITLRGQEGVLHLELADGADAARAIGAQKETAE